MGGWLVLDWLWGKCKFLSFWWEAETCIYCSLMISSPLSGKHFRLPPSVVKLPLSLSPVSPQVNGN